MLAEFSALLVSIMDESLEPTKSQMVASIISRTGTGITAASAKTISYRVPVYSLARVDAMAQQAGKSRNSMLNLLLDVALDEVGGQLDEQVFQEVQSREIVAMRSLLDEPMESISE